MKVTLRAFYGLRPASADDLLKQGEAVVCQNAYITGNELTPINAPSTVTSLSAAGTINTIYRFGQSSASETQYWLQSNNDANIVKGPVDGDTEERTYATGLLTYPSKTKADIATVSAPYPTNSLPLGLGQPSAAPTAVVTGTATVSTSTAEQFTYVITFVTAWGEESPPSAASNSVAVQAGQTVNLSALAATAVASYPGNSTKSQSFTGKRIYRSATGSSGTARFLLVNTEGDLALATSTYADTKLTLALGNAIMSRGWLEPPDNMTCLTQMANGILAGASGSMVCFSEPGVPYAWPVKYQQAVDAPVVGMAAFNQSLLVATKRSLYVFTGPDPAGITSERLAVMQTCVSKRSMVEMLGGVVFATPDGLGYVGPGGFKMISEGLLYRRDWQSYKPSSMTAYESDGRYICFYDTGAVQAGLMFKLEGEPSMTTLSYYATAGFRERASDALYLCSGVNVQKWDAGAAATMTWTSGVFRMPSAFNMGAARVVCTGAINFELIADGVVVYGPMTITTNLPFKLPGGYRAARYQIRLTGTGTVLSAELGDTITAVLND